MKKQFLQLIKMHGFELYEYEFVNNFDWKYVNISISKDGMFVDNWDYEYNIYDEDYKSEAFIYFEKFLISNIEQP